MSSVHGAHNEPGSPRGPASTRPRLFTAWTLSEARRIADVLRQETVGGALLLMAMVAALGWANSPWSAGYTELRDTLVGPARLHLQLPLAVWAADGLLVVFFFVAGLEVKREFVAGDLRDLRRAALPVSAAIGGMVVPAVIYLLVNRGGDALRGWAIPVATDIAFALAVLAVISSHLPAALRTFLLTLAVVDDLLAITIIAAFFTTDLQPVPLLLALVPLGLFGALVRRRARAWWLLLPLAFATWTLVHASGVHATVAGVLLAFTVPVLHRGAAGSPERGPGPAERFERRLRPVSAAVCVPVFAFFSAGVTIGGPAGLRAALTDPIAVGIVLGLVVGKSVGVLGAAWLVARLTHAELDQNLAWVDIFGLSLLAGIGFTVSLLIGELAFGLGSERDGLAKAAVLSGSVLAACLAAVVLRLRDGVHRRIAEAQDAAPAQAVDGGTAI